MLSDANVTRLDQEQWLSLLQRLIHEPASPVLVKRSGSRFDLDADVFAEAVLIYRLPGEENFTERTLRIVQVSESGVMLRSSFGLPRGLDVLAHFHIADTRSAVLARVMHSTDTLGGYKIGLRLLLDR